MAEDANRFIKLLDQVLPFLAASPTLLKYWIYILILLNAATIGASLSRILHRGQPSKRKRLLPISQSTGRRTAKPFRLAMIKPGCLRENSQLLRKEANLTLLS